MYNIANIPKLAKVFKIAIPVILVFAGVIATSVGATFVKNTTGRTDILAQQEIISAKIAGTQVVVDEANNAIEVAEARSSWEKAKDAIFEQREVFAAQNSERQAEADAVKANMAASTEVAAAQAQKIADEANERAKAFEEKRAEILGQMTDSGSVVDTAAE